VGNKIGNKIQEETIARFARKNNIQILDFVPFDQKVVEAEMQGETPLNDKNSQAVRTIEKLSMKLTSKESEKK
jgi:CO dehydrogenase nickel-insertion accessory protein CooC1